MKEIWYEGGGSLGGVCSAVAFVDVAGSDEIVDVKRGFWGFLIDAKLFG